MLNLGKGDILITKHTWTKYSSTMLSIGFYRNRKYKIINIIKDSEYPYYWVKGEKRYSKYGTEFDEILLTENDILDHFDYISEQRKRKLKKLKNL